MCAAIGDDVVAGCALSSTSGSSGSIHWFLCCTSYMVLCLQMGSTSGSGPWPRSRLCLHGPMSLDKYRAIAIYGKLYSVLQGM